MLGGVERILGDYMMTIPSIEDYRFVEAVPAPAPEEPKPKSKPRTKLNPPERPSAIRNQAAFDRALAPYRIGTPECQHIEDFLIGKCRLCKYAYVKANSTAGERRYKSKRYRFVSNGTRYLAVQPTQRRDESAGFDVLVFACFPCREDGTLRVPSKKYDHRPPMYLTAPELLAWKNGCEVPLSSEERGHWRETLEKYVFAGDAEPRKFRFPDAPLPELADPSFLLEEDVSWEDEYGDLRPDRRFWFWLTSRDRTRALQQKVAQRLFKLYTFFRTEWASSAQVSSDGLPRMVQASCSFLAKRFNVSAYTAWNDLSMLVHGGLLAPAFENESGVRDGVRLKPSLSYLPGTGQPQVASTEDIGYIRTPAVMRRYRHASGLYYPWEVKLLTPKWEAEYKKAEQEYWKSDEGQQELKEQREEEEREAARKKEEEAQIKAKMELLKRLFPEPSTPRTPAYGVHPDPYADG